MESDNLSLLLGLNHKLADAQREIDELKAEARRREGIWRSRLQEADKRTERIWRLKVDPPVLIIEPGALGHFSLEPGGIIEAGKPGTIVSADEWPKTERVVIEVSEVIYFRDFLRSLWRRLRGRCNS